MPTRTASAEWTGGLKDGEGSFGGESGTVSGSYSFGSRFESGDAANPEELLAAAEAACFSMALSAALEKNGTPSRYVRTHAACTIDRVGDGFAITTMRLTVRALVPEIDAAKFQELAEATKSGCPISRAISGNVEIVMEARLD
jgi:lipoyl-dependent peroxiredoxin